MSREKILNNIKDNIAIENFRTINKKRERTKKILQSTLTVAMCSLSITGIVFAKDISNQIYNKYFTGKGVEKAINEGYIENTEMKEQSSNSTIQDEETGKIIEDNETKVKVSELIMDDFTLSMTFEVKLSDKVKDIITAKDVMEMNFPDIVVYDENNNVLNSVYNDYLKKFSEKNNIAPKEVIGSGVNIFVSEKNENTVKVIYNFYTGGECVYPKSKELHIDMNKINISKNVESIMGDEEISIKGNWNFKVYVPEKMYNRQNISYRQKSTSNKDFNVESAILYNTGMEIKMKFKAEKQLSMKEIGSSVSKELQFYWSLDKNDELRNIDILNYLENKERDNPEYQKLVRQEMEKWEFDKYLTNSNGQRFNFSVGPRENGSAYIDDGIMTSTCMFDLTKYDATDEIVLHLEYKGTKADIVLEKVKQ